MEPLLFIAVEDHPVVVDALRGVIQRNYPSSGFQAYDNPELLMKKGLHDTASFIFFDLMLHGVLSLQSLYNIRQLYPNAKIMVLSSFEDELYAGKVMSIGVDGFINKREPLSYIESAVKLIMSGGSLFKKNAIVMSQGATREALAPAGENPFSKLGNREFEVCVLLLEGFELGEISEALDIARSTVYSHKMNLLEKLGVKNTIQLKELASIYDFCKK